MTRPKAPYTDLENTKRFLNDHGKDIRYSAEEGLWYCYRENFWQKQSRNSQLPVTLAMKTINKLIDTVTKKSDDEKQVNAVQALGSHNKITNIVKLAKAVPDIQIDIEQLNPNPYLLNCQNGVVDLETGDIENHDRSHNFNYVTPIEYDPEARFKLWDRMVSDICLGDEEFIDWLQKACGYSIIGNNKEQVIFICYGKRGQNGKSTFLTAIKDVLGTVIAQQANYTTFTVKRDGGASPDVVRMRNAHMVIASEGEDGEKLTESFIKGMTGGDAIVGRGLYQDLIEFKSKMKPWLSSNHRPKIDGTSDSIWRRIKVVPFRKYFTEVERDRNIQEKLATPEAQKAILAWLVEGAIRWFSEGLGTCEAVEDATKTYRLDQLPVAVFVNDMLEVAPDNHIRMKTMYEIYKEWCEAQNSDPMGKKDFNKQFAIMRGVDKKKYQGTPTWKGMKFIVRVEDEGAVGN